MYYAMKVGHKLRLQLCSIVFKKTMILAADQRSNVTSGKVVNILSSGVARCDKITVSLCQLASFRDLNMIVFMIIYYNNIIYMKIGKTQISYSP